MIKEMSPRDGLQNEPAILATEQKIALIEALAETGLSYIEATAFVSPKAIPQLADADEVMKKIKKKKGVTYAALVPNRKGMERAISSGADEVAVFTAASETFNQKNIRASIEESFQRFSDVFPLARDRGMKVRGYVSTAFVCPYEGEVDPIKASEVILRLLDVGCYEVSIGDTIGKATPESVSRLLDRIVKETTADRLAGHFHDTYGNALSNVLKAMEFGIQTFDTSVGGLGGCPYAPGAGGNLATEKLMDALHAQGLNTGLQTGKIREISKMVRAWRT
jgi:hydroxymethylglutaryl-CoA lyase